MKLPIIPKCNKNFQAFLHCEKWRKYLTKWLIYIISCVNDLLIVSKVGIAISVSFFPTFCAISISKYINNVIKNFEKSHMKCLVPFLFKTGRWPRTISSDTSRSKVWFSAPEYVPGRSLEASTCRSAMTRYISYSVLWRSNDSRTFYPRRSPAIVPLRLADDPNTELSVHRLCSIWVNVFKSFDLCVSCISIYCLNHISPS